MPTPVIIDGLRTPFIKAATDFNTLPAQELGRIVVSELLAKTELDPSLIDETIFGNIGQPAEAANIARVVSLNAGIGRFVPAYTVQRNCASGMESIAQAFDKISLGFAKVIMAGGTESMSNIPLMFPKAYADFLNKLMRSKTPLQKLLTLTKFKLSYLKPRIALMEGLTDPFCGLNMGQTAEVLAREWGISREEQDQFSLQSHQKVLKAQDEGKFLEEITSVYIPPKYSKAITEDNGPRRNQTMGQLMKLKPFFDRRYGTVTAGNSSQITDGAVAVLVMDKEKAYALGYTPLATIRSYGFFGIEPKRMGIGPVAAAKVALERAHLTLKDIGLIEINEAFAAQTLAVLKASASKKFSQDYLGQSEPLGEMNPEILNVNGGAIALGHPVGASGARIVVTLAKEMKRRSVRYGLALICIGGGQGGAMVIEREMS
ncbi:MAG: acetyl-CoA acyltransferase [Deltaproteobacteria bacterium GWA2_38_16]|nr:MAG: acetyl-CoA acyltransferase [Deltaproteobacteria bacterium GWA2_38_16]OGQ02196.1 MAG: acetyl-CoA acyltransferase [Deltaproteobacteria bacterium RIFCSPHIGHO2_02_FULL_38_15]HBQ21992.1 acetyl-CoA C-acyltransferase [Deltaproteobacteria bacterium]